METTATTNKETNTMNSTDTNQGTVGIGNYRSLWKSEHSDDGIKVRNIEAANDAGTVEITQFKGQVQFTASTVRISNHTRPFDENDLSSHPEGTIGVKVGGGESIEITGGKRHMAEMALAILQQVDLTDHQQERIGYFRAGQEAN